ncbi:hypothetical protein [Sphingorhabdus sp. EL138]|uniref:hypothetical protein n=1 Tax=Sphingorhabdus sp. EL138 TaxID=2073156 RepID=UPI0025DEF9F9|nr:hypothetical protein [Sphingorhabdus sp. EL138]
MISTMILTLFLAGAAASETPQRTASVGAGVTAQDEKKAKPKKICRSTKFTGSRITKATCKTQEQWDQAEYAAELSVKGRAGTTAPPQMNTNM